VTINVARSRRSDITPVQCDIEVADCEFTGDLGNEFGSTIPYFGVDITYDDRDDRFSDLVETFKQIFSSMPERILIKN